VAEQVPAVGNVLATIERRDWGRLEGLLDPEVHWTTAAARRADHPLDRHPRMSLGSE
jgi:hypothetical protein